MLKGYKVQDGYHYLLKCAEVLGINEEESAFCGDSSTPSTTFGVETKTDLQVARAWFLEGIRCLGEGGVTFDQRQLTGTRKTLTKSLLLALQRCREECQRGEVDPNTGRTFAEIKKEEDHYQEQAIQNGLESLATKEGLTGSEGDVSVALCRVAAWKGEALSAEETQRYRNLFLSFLPKR